MIVQCPSCAAKFRVADEKIKPQGVKVRCGRCKNIFRVRRSEGSAGSGATHPARPAATDAAEGSAPKAAGAAALRKALASDDEATRVVHDPVAEALDDYPEDVDNPLVRSGTAWNRSGDAAGATDDALPRFTESGLGLQRPQVGLHPEQVGNTLAPGLAANDTAEAVEPARADGRPSWLITGSAGDFIAESEDSDEADAEPPPFQPPVTDEHSPHGPFIGGRSGFEPPVEGNGPHLTRRDALASLGDPMPERDLSWDVEGETAPRLVFDDSEPHEAVGSTSDVTSALDEADRSAEQKLPGRETPRSGDSRSEAAPPGRSGDDEQPPPDEELASLTFSHRTVARDERMAVWLGTVLGIVIVAVGFLTFVASKNDWLLDFRRLDQMVGVAFGADAYEPRAVRTVRVYELDGERIEEPVAPGEPEAAEALAVRNLEQSVYRTRNDVHLLLVEGDLVNADASPHRNVVVGGQVYRRGEAGDETVVASVAGPVGRTLTPEELEAVTDTETLLALFDRVADEAASLVINPNQRSRFCLVFARFEGRWDEADLRYTVEVVQTERRVDDEAWHRVVYVPSFESPWLGREGIGGAGTP